MTEPIEPWSPYGGDDPIVSAGRRTLVSAFSGLIRCQAGFEPHELADVCPLRQMRAKTMYVAILSERTRFSCPCSS